MKKLLNKKLYIMLLAFVSAICCFFALFLQPKTAFASQQDDGLFLPTSRLEYYDFSVDKPLDAVKFDGGVAIITSNNEYNTLWIYSNAQNKYVKYDRFTLNNPIHIKLLDSDTLIVNNNLTLYTIDVSDIDNTEILPTERIGADRFDVSGDYLITRIGNVISVYNSISNDNHSVGNNNGMVNTPVCVNSNGQYFYISKNNSNLVYRDVNSPLNESEEMTLVSNVTPTDMIATNEHLFYVNGGEIYKVTLSDKSVVKLLSSSDFDLGKINNANSISFSGDNLLVTDNALNAVQEFEVNGNTLYFTGFAVSKNKTAFNRVSEGDKQISRLNDLVAVLDEKKLTIIKSDANFNSHNEDCFINIDKTDLNNPTSISLGDKNVLLAYADNSLKLLSLNDYSTLTDVQANIPGEIKDTFYLSGRYYSVYREVSGNTIISFDENGLDFKIEDTIEGVVSDLLPEKICVDVFGNIYLADNSFVYKNGVKIANRDAFIDFDVDFFGNLFAVKDNAALYFDGETWKTSYTASGVIDTFCMNFEKSEVYYFIDGLELIFRTEKFNNTALSSFTLPQGFNTHTQPTDSNFTAVTKIEDKFIASISINDGVKYLGESKEETFVLLDDNLTVSTVNGDKGVYLLAGEKSVAICHFDGASILNIERTPQSNKTIYVATPVNAYALPVITDENVYTLLQNSSVLRLDKGVIASVTESFSFLDREYYFAVISDQNGSFNCFIPSSFTVDVLAEDVKTDKFTYSYLLPCEIYTDSDLTINLTSVDEETSIRLYSISDGVAKIGVYTNGQLLEGYVNAKFINTKPDLTVRNILIILAVLVCLCGSTAFFLLRKKK